MFKGFQIVTPGPPHYPGGGIRGDMIVLFMGKQCGFQQQACTQCIVVPNAMLTQGGGAFWWGVWKTSQAPRASALYQWVRTTIAVEYHCPIQYPDFVIHRRIEAKWQQSHMQSANVPAKFRVY